MRRAADPASLHNRNSARVPVPGRHWTCAVVLLLAVAGSCTAADNTLRLAITTTTDNTGLIAYLIPTFETGHGVSVRVMAGGTGKALRLLANGDVDVALTHARTLELPLIESGAVIDRQEIMYNDYLIVGPASDPAGVLRADSLAASWTTIARAQQRFVSRGDNSGTHVEERRLWRLAGIIPRGDWYLETGQGMGKTLQIAGELEAYTLTDRATWLAYGSRTGLTALYRDEAQLRNVYSVMRANPRRHPRVNERGAIALSSWLRSTEARRLIEEFRIDGHRLFIPLSDSG